MFLNEIISKGFFFFFYVSILASRVIDALSPLILLVIGFDEYPAPLTAVIGLAALWLAVPGTILRLAAVVGGMAGLRPVPVFNVAGTLMAVFEKENNAVVQNLGKWSDIGKSSYISYWWWPPSTAGFQHSLSELWIIAQVLLLKK
jgi:hypothetical protein